jgi:hypothetical protein
MPPRIICIPLILVAGCNLYFDPSDRGSPDAGELDRADGREHASDARLTGVDAAPAPASMRVLVVHGFDAPEEAWMIEGALEADGRFDDVDAWELGPDNAQLPGPAALAAYDVLVYGWNDGAIIDTDARVYLGNWMADYVDAGGGLVTLGNAQGRSALLGRILTAGYLPLRPPASAPYTLATPAGLVADLPDHPLLTGVDAVTSSRRAVTLADPEALVVASWDDGLPLAALDGSVASLGVQLDPTDITLAGDWQRLLANAAAAVAVGD